MTAREWPARLKWLRAAGVGSVIAGDVPPGLPGLVPVFTEGRFGPAATLYRLADPLPGTRRLSRVRGAASVSAAVALVDDPAFDPATDGVVAGRPPAGTDVPDADPGARARVLAEGPDALVVETSGSGPALLLVDRSFTPRVRATVNGRKGTVYATELPPRQASRCLPEPRGSRSSWRLTAAPGAEGQVSNGVLSKQYTVGA